MNEESLAFRRGNVNSALDMAERDERVNWRVRAICRSEDPELFYPVSSSGHVYAAQVERAKAVCSRCPVRPECLSEALATPQAGIWGGLTAEERQQLRRGGRAG